MADIKLARLPDRTPIKIAIVVMPELNDRLRAYGTEEPVAELIPAMLAAFLESDHAFSRAKARKS